MKFYVLLLLFLIPISLALPVATMQTCINISHNGTLTDYTALLPISLNNTKTNGSDIRIHWNNGTDNILPYYRTEFPIQYNNSGRIIYTTPWNPADASGWIATRIPVINDGVNATTICVYYNFTSPVPDTSNGTATFLDFWDNGPLSPVMININGTGVKNTTFINLSANGNGGITSTSWSQNTTLSFMLLANPLGGDQGQFSGFSDSFPTYSGNQFTVLDSSGGDRYAYMGTGTGNRNGVSIGSYDSNWHNYSISWASNYSDARFYYDLVSEGLTDASYYPLPSTMPYCFGFACFRDGYPSNYVEIDLDNFTVRQYAPEEPTYIQEKVNKTISTCSDLQNMNNDLLGNYILSGNINCSGFDSGDGGGFLPIAPFTGTFDGQNYTISNLYINRSEDYQSLFGYANGATIKNVGIINASITGQRYAGGLIAQDDFSVISNSYATGHITGDTSVGGLIGVGCYSSISSSNSSASVDSNGNYAGGLIGDSGDCAETIISSFATGNVTGTGYVGGLIGHTEGTILNSHATGNVTGSASNTGGLVGGAGYGVGILSSFATGNVNGSIVVGGLIGSSDTIVLINSYATGNVTDLGGFGGGLIGYSTGDIITDTYAHGTVTGAAYEDGGLIGYAAYDNISNATATGDVNAAEQAGGLIGGTIGSPNIINTSYATGNVNGSNEIGGLIGESDADTILDSYATGNVTAHDGIAGGLIGETDNGDTITNCYATGDASAVDNTNTAGGLIGYSSGGDIITNCYATGDVWTNEQYAGGLIGKADTCNSGLINISYATGDVSGYDTAGGLIGSSCNNVVDNCYAQGIAITIYGDTGGLIGNSTADIVTNSYASGSVSNLFGNSAGGFIGSMFEDTLVNDFSAGLVANGASDVGGFVGFDAGYGGSSSLNNYWDSYRSNQTACLDGGGMSDCTGMNTSGTPTYFYNKNNAPLLSWDFQSIWYAHANAYPTFLYGTPPAPPGILHVALNYPYNNGNLYTDNFTFNWTVTGPDKAYLSNISIIGYGYFATDVPSTNGTMVYEAVIGAPLGFAQWQVVSWNGSDVGSSQIYNFTVLPPVPTNFTLSYQILTAYSNYTVANSKITVQDTGNYLLNYTSPMPNNNTLLLVLGAVAVLFAMLAIKLISDMI
jgi:hypothetical protein